MKNLVNSIVLQGLSLLSVPSIVIWASAYVPDVILVIAAITFVSGGLVSVIAKKRKLGISIFIIAAIIIGLLVVKHTNEDTKKESIVARNDDRLVRQMVSTDTTGWRLYEERNPEMLASIALTLLDQAASSQEVGGIQYIDLAERLLDESANEGAWNAYLGYAYMYSKGLGSKKYERLAVDNLNKSLSIRKTNEAYSLFEQLKLDSTAYPREYAQTCLWRNEYNEYIAYVNADTRILSSVIDPIFEGVPVQRWKGFDILDSLYRGDTSSLCWKMMNKHVSILSLEARRTPTSFPLFLTAYYYGIGKVDSSHFFYDMTLQQKILGYAALWYGEFAGTKSFNLNGDLLPILKYSSSYLLELESHLLESSLQEYPYLRLAFQDAADIRLKNPTNQQIINEWRYRLIMSEKPVIKDKNHKEDYRGTSIEFKFSRGFKRI